MAMKQILILAMSFASVWTCMQHADPCYDEHQVIKLAWRKLKNRFPPPKVVLSREQPGDPVTCPLELYQTLPARGELRTRSLSPWRYVTVNMTDHFPSSYVTAQCLCTGCILFKDNKVQENHDYSSVTLIQKQTFLKRVRCRTGKGYKLEPVSVDVAVGCTCVRSNI